MTVVVGTAGHIDHGKTALLRALTGIDADRLPDERRRGMTIDVGYAHLELANGAQIDFVDVPGHDRLVGNMLVGAGEVDAVLLVVAADDGPRPQTLEHLGLIDALAVCHGVIAITKADLVSAERLDEVAGLTRELVARTSLAGAPLVTVSATAGTGLSALADELSRLRDRVTAAGLPTGSGRLAIDRAFSVRGRGTVVTGTLRGGPLERGMTLRLVPGDRQVRIRELQVHGRRVDRVAGGGRTALNLGGLETTDVGRGMVLTAGPDVVASDHLLVALTAAPLPADERGPIPRNGARVRVHVGTDQVAGVVARSTHEATELPTGEVASILRLERPVAIAAGDRFVLRRPSPAVTLAGGRVLDARPPRGVSRRRATPARLAALALAVSDDALRAAGLDLHGAVGGPQPWLATDVAAAIRAEILRSVAAAAPWQARAALRPAIARSLRRHATMTEQDADSAAAAAIDELIADGQLAAKGGLIGDPDTALAGPDPGELSAMDRLEETIDVPAPPALSEAAQLVGCSAEGVRLLESSGRIVRVDDDLAFAAATYRRLESRALSLAADGPLAPATFRDETGTSRKFVMALLEDFNRRGVLRRTPEGHVPGPRAAASIGSSRR